MEESLEEESWMWNYGGAMRTNHGGDIWEAFGKHLGSISNSFRFHLVCIWKTFGGLEAEEASGRHLEVRSHKSATPLSYNAKDPPKCGFYLLFLRVGVSKAYYLL